jgi:hypothetical protein
LHFEIHRQIMAQVQCSAKILRLSLLKIPSEAEFKQQREIDFEFALKERIRPRSAGQMFNALLRSNKRSSDEA